MDKALKKILNGYEVFKKKYATGDNTLMEQLAIHGQQPKVMVVACCDSRVDPALVLQSEPGDLFTVRNIANLIPPYEPDETHHSTSAALEFGLCHLNVKHLILLGHSQCGGIKALSEGNKPKQDDFINRWVSLINIDANINQDPDELGKHALVLSYQNCLTYPWIQERVMHKQLQIHLWYFDVKTGEISEYSFDEKHYHHLRLY